MFTNNQAIIKRLSSLLINFKNFLSYLVKVLSYYSPLLIPIFEDFKGVIIHSEV